MDMVRRYVMVGRPAFPSSRDIRRHGHFQVVHGLLALAQAYRKRVRMNTPDTTTAIITAAGSGGITTLILYLFGRGRERRKDEVSEEAQHIINAVSLKTSEQKTIDQLMTRLDKLEAWKERAEVKMEMQATDKVRLESEKAVLQQELTSKEALIKKLQQDSTMYDASIRELQEMVAVLREKLASTELRLVKYEPVSKTMVELDPDN